METALMFEGVRSLDATDADFELSVGNAIVTRAGDVSRIAAHLFATLYSTPCDATTWHPDAPELWLPAGRDPYEHEGPWVRLSIVGRYTWAVQATGPEGSAEWGFDTVAAAEEYRQAEFGVAAEAVFVHEPTFINNLGVDHVCGLCGAVASMNYWETHHTCPSCDHDDEVGTAPGPA